MCLSRSSAATRRCRKPCAESRPARLSARVSLVAEHAHVHAGVAQVGACLDGGHGDEPDARVLELLGDGVAEDGPNRLVDATHATAAHPTPRIGSAYPDASLVSSIASRRGHPRRSSTETTIRSTRTPCGSRSSSQRSTRSTAVAERRQVAAHERRGQRAALPQVLWPVSATATPEPRLQLRLHRRQLLALALQAAGVGEVHVDHEHGDEAARVRHRPIRRARARPSASRRPRARRPP